MIKTKNIVSFFLVSLLLISCGSKEDFGVVGKVANYDPNSSVKQVYLFQLQDQRFIAKDTAVIQENGVFKLKTKDLPVDLYTIGTTPQNALLLYIEDENTQELTINDITNWGFNYSVKGNETSAKINEFVDVINERINLGKTYNKQMTDIDFNDTIKLNQLRNEFEAELNKIKSKRDDFINNNLNSPALYATLSEINQLKELDLFKKVVNEGLAKTIPQSGFYTNTKLFLNDLVEKDRVANLIKPGNPAPELSFPNPDGTIIPLSSLKGKVVLVDFWASWCKPCRMENPRVVGLYNKYKNAGFDIYSFSLDQDKGRWVNAIQQDGLVWKNHTSDLRGWQTAALPLYGFNAIPFTVLIDKEGNVIEKNLRGPALQEKLKSIFGY